MTRAPIPTASPPKSKFPTRSFELDPNYADAHGMYGTYFIAMGSFDQAIAERKRAQELDPLSPLFNTSVRWAYFYAKRYDEAIDWYKKSVELDTNFVQAHNELGTAYSLKGMHAEAVQELPEGQVYFGSKARDSECAERRI